MRIANVMFGRGLGGIEQAFLDYNEALLLAGYEVLAITHPLASVIPQITGKLDHDTVANYGNWDPFAVRRLRKIYGKWRPDAVISHGNRALNLNDRARRQALHIGVTHNYRHKHFGKLDAVFATTADLERYVRHRMPSLQRIARIPNMVRAHPRVPPSGNTVPVIGTMGRFIHKKGMHLLMEAVQQLKARGVDCRLHIGGSGQEDRRLRALAKKLGIADRTTFVGWVEDKAAFFERMDVFCLSSLDEPFGIVVLEAMAYGRPIVSFSTKGPTDILGKGEAVLVPLGDVPAMAQALAALLQDSDRRESMTTAARQRFEAEYALPVVSQKIDATLKAWLQP